MSAPSYGCLRGLPALLAAVQIATFAAGQPVDSAPTASAPTAPPATNQPDADSLARLTPADIGLFVEARGLDDLLLALSEPTVWTTIAELAGQPAEPEAAEIWRARVQRTVRMPPELAIRVLFQQRVAFVGDGLGRAQDAVILCRPLGQFSPQKLLDMWNARPWPELGDPQAHHLAGSIGVAVRDQVLMFGDDSLPQGLLRRMIQFTGPRAAETTSLADNADYRALLSRVPRDPDAVLYFRRDRASLPLTASAPVDPAASQPNARLELPGPLRDATRVMLAVKRDLQRPNEVLHITAVGNAASERVAPTRELQPVVESLPAEALLTYGSYVDFRTVLAGIRNLPPRNVLRLALEFQERSDNVARLVDSLGTAVVVSFGAVPQRPRQADNAPDVPAVALLVQARDASVAERELSILLQSLAAVYNLYALSSGGADLPPVVQRDVLGHETRLLDLTPLVRERFDSGFGRLQLCWTRDEDILIVASDVQWLRQVLAARRGDGDKLQRALALSAQVLSAHSQNILVGQPGAIGDLGTRWLEYFARRHPEVLQESWWRARQPGGGIRLGISVVEDPENRRLRVESVDPTLPVAGVLKVGDYIIACNGQRFTTDSPVREIRQAIDSRPSARWLDVLVERDAVILPRRVPIQFFDATQILRRVVAVGRILNRFVYFDDLPDRYGSRGLVTVELRTDRSRRLETPAQPPIAVGEDLPPD